MRETHISGRGTGAVLLSFSLIKPLYAKWFEKREKRIDSPFIVEKVGQREEIKVGVMGLPHEASREIGEKICNEIIDGLVAQGF